ncbi:hypothetical protein ACH4E7_45175 [Kitasatospora sp. NPDC018058]|uniref:hypothetical protein n=1 Tax=Kitasatospora sp. NPDC018058 TaxID=3364025 RepID=UPI0037C183D9
MTRAQRFRARYGIAPGEEEIRSWRRSWPVLLDAVVRVGAGDPDVLLEPLLLEPLLLEPLLLELSLLRTGERVDAAVAGQEADGALTVAVVELKQWTRAVPSTHDPGMLEIGQRSVPHPARQVGGYVHYLRAVTTSPTSFPPADRRAASAAPAWGPRRGTSSTASS